MSRAEEDNTFNIEGKFKYDGRFLTVDTTTFIGKMCARLFGYLIWAAEEKDIADMLFKRVGM